MIHKMPIKKPKIIVISGPTAVGKSSLAVKLAQKFNGEIVSADSRQVYKGLDIGTGKIKKNEMKGVQHFMLDIANPQNVYTASDYKNDAQKAVEEIYERNKIPIICGGTGFYIDTLIYDTSFPNVAPNNKLRKKLSKKNAEELAKILKKMDPERALNIDIKNPRRLIRAIEIAEALGKVPKIKKKKKYNVLHIYIDMPDHKLKRRINKRLLERIKGGMVAEAQKLKRGGLGFKRMKELGLEYKYLALFLEKKIAKKEIVQKLDTEIWRYAKRQRTWFKRTKNIFTVDISTVGAKKNVEKEVSKFLSTD